MQVFLVVASPYTKLLARDFEGQRLQRAGFDFRVVDAGDVYLPHLRNHYGDLENGSNVTYIRNQDQLNSFASSLTASDVVFFDAVTDEHLSSPESLYNVVSKSTAKLAGASTGIVTPPPPFSADAAHWLRRRSRQMQEAIQHPRETVSWVGKRISRRIDPGSRFWGSANSQPIPQSKPLNFLWIGHSSNLFSSRIISNSTFVRYIHTMDYELISRETIKEAQECDYLVFLDGMGPSHPDLLQSTPSQHYKISSSEYRRLIGRALKSVELLTGYRVIVAAHPRNPAGSLVGAYGHFPVSEHNTPGLVAGSRAVIDAGCSTSLGMAVVARRPVLFLKSGFFAKPIDRRQRDTARSLALPRISIDEPVTKWRIPDVNLLAYQRYVETFMKRRDTAQGSFWDQVAKDLRTIVG